MGLVKVLVSALNWSNTKLFDFENEPTLSTKSRVLRYRRKKYNELLSRTYLQYYHSYATPFSLHKNLARLKEIDKQKQSWPLICNGVIDNLDFLLCLEENIFNSF